MTLFYLILVSWLGIAGDCVLKSAANIKFYPYLYVTIGAMFYAATAPGWYYVLQREKITTTVGAFYPLIQSITILFVGSLFDEALTTREMLGLFLSFLSLFLLIK